MKKLQRLGIATVFTIVLTTVTLAGDISTPGIAQPTPSPSSAMTAGETPIGESSSTSEVDVSESSLLTDVALNLLQIMLSVF
jgi:hypothetical protein